MKYYKIVDNNTLVHYSSPYYDPVKAHEYYEQHKKLNGRTTSGLNETGRKAANYVKTEINKERDSRISDEHSKYSKDLKIYMSRANSLVRSLKDKLRKMNKAQRKIFGPKILEQLNKLKIENEAKRSELLGKYKTEKEKITSEAESKYQNELSKISSDSSMVTQKTVSNKSSKASSSSSTKKKSETTKASSSSLTKKKSETTKTSTKKKTKKKSNKRTPEDIKDLIQKGKEKYGW